MTRSHLAVYTLIAACPSLAVATEICWQITANYRCCSIVPDAQPVYCPHKCEAIITQDPWVSNAFEAETGWKTESLISDSAACEFRRPYCGTTPEEPCTWGPSQPVNCVNEKAPAIGTPDCP